MAACTKAKWLMDVMTAKVFAYMPVMNFKTVVILRWEPGNQTILMVNAASFMQMVQKLTAAIRMECQTELLGKFGLMELTLKTIILL